MAAALSNFLQHHDPMEDQFTFVLNRLTHACSAVPKVGPNYLAKMPVVATMPAKRAKTTELQYNVVVDK